MGHPRHALRRGTRLAATLTFQTATAKIQLGGAVALVSLVTVALMLAMGVAAIQVATTSTVTISDLGHRDIPPVALAAYQRAASQACDELDWPILAGIGKVETNHGRHNGTTLLTNGDTSTPILGPDLDGTGTGGNHTPLPAGQWQHTWGLGTQWQQALGPMQFLPATFSHYAPNTEATPHNINDAAAAAAALLCDHDPSDIETAILAYNHSTDYVDQVLQWAALYTQTGGIPSATALALIDHPNITLTPAAEQDLRDGIIDPRLINILTHIADNYQLSILSFKTGHPRCKVLPNHINAGPNCNISNHWEGRAADITATSEPGQPLQGVSPHNQPAQDITRWLATLPTNNPARPDEVGSPWTTFESYHGHFSNRLHQDHLHIGYHT